VLDKHILDFKKSTSLEGPCRRESFDIDKVNIFQELGTKDLALYQLESNSNWRLGANFKPWTCQGSPKSKFIYFR